MDFTNEFRVSLPVEQSWTLLTDVERIAPAMPGAQLTGVEGDDYSGTVKVKVGPVTVQYKGVATFESKDEDSHTAVLRARGRDTRGQGNANALITATLAPDGDGTRVTVATRLTITGKIAQFGRGMIEDISKKLLAQFVANLEEQLIAERRPEPEPEPEPALQTSAAGATGAAAGTAGTAPEPATAEPAAGEPEQKPSGEEPVASEEKPAGRPAPRPAAPEPAPVSLMSVAGGAVLKRLVPAVVILLAVVALIVWLVVG